MSTRTPLPADDDRRRPARWQGAVAGVVSVGLGVALAEVVALLLDTTGLFIAVGNRVIDLAPAGAKEFAIAVFGQADKLALLIGTGILLALAAAGIGVAALRDRRYGIAGVLALGLVGAAAELQDAQAGALGVVPPFVAAVVSGFALLVLLAGAQLRALSDAPTEDGSPLDLIDRLGEKVNTRRSFLIVSALAAVSAAGIGGVSQVVRRQLEKAVGRDQLVLPDAAQTVDPVPAGARVDVEGMKPFITPNDEFYRIDTALSVPRVDINDWKLRVTGMVDNELEFTWDELVSRPMIDIPITLTCVSNQVGDELISTARWRGIDLRDLLADAGVQPGANQIIGRSVDGYTCGFPTEIVGSRPALLALGFNGEPLPLERGFPARLVVSGLYGYVSATKWLEEIQVTTFEDTEQYWVPRGWDAEAPIKVLSRVEVPKPLGRIPAGETFIAGSAWAQNRGIAKVEVRIDDGEWQEAELAEQVNIHTWRQWRLPWTATSGRHDIAVRATDADGVTQTEERVPPKPNGATGWHSIAVFVA